MPTRVRVLLVDDQDIVCKAMTRLFAAEDVEIATARSGEKALEELAHTPADIVISDQFMAGMDGIALLSEVRSRWPATLRVLMTGQPACDVTMNAVNQAGIHAILVKSEDPVEHKRLVADLISRRRAADER